MNAHQQITINCCSFLRFKLLSIMLRSLSHCVIKSLIRRIENDQIKNKLLVQAYQAVSNDSMT